MSLGDIGAPASGSKLGATCEKLRLVYWLYNNDDNGCGPLQGLPIAWFGDWTMDLFECDGRNILPGPTPITYSNWNDNFNQWTGVLNGGISAHQWDWINAGRPCFRVMATITCDNTVYGDFKLTAVDTGREGVDGNQYTIQPGVIVGPELEILVCRTMGKDGEIVKEFFEKSGAPITSLADYYASKADYIKEPTTGAVPFTVANIAKFYSEDDLCNCLKDCAHEYAAIDDSASCIIQSYEGACIYVRDAETGEPMLIESGVSATVLWSPQGALKSRSLVRGQFQEDPSDNDYIVLSDLPEGWYVDPTCTGAEPVDPAGEPCPEATIEPCPDPCRNGSTYINGRPPASNAWSWGPYFGDNLNEFEAALTAAGYTVTRFGEKHQICPPFGAFGEDAEAILTNGIGDGFVPPTEPNIDPDFVPVDKCAELTVGKNDDRRDNLLECIKNGPPKQTSVDNVTYCAFLDGDVTNCATDNVVEYLKAIKTCTLDGEIIDRSVTDFELDGVTPLDTSSFSEETVSIECERDDAGNLIVCHTTCYEYEPPVLVRPIKTVTSVKQQIKLVKQLTAVSVKAALVVRRGAEQVRALALGTDPESTSEPAPFMRGTCVRIRSCCICGTVDPISETYQIKTLSSDEFVDTEPFDLDGNWVEKNCDPALDCPSDMTVELDKCTLGALTCTQTTCKVTQEATYSNSDNTTDIEVSVAGTADLIKIGSSGDDPDGDDSVIESLIENCLNDGNEVEIEWTTIPVTEGAPVGMGSGTLTGIDSGTFADGQLNATGSLTWDGGTTPGGPGQAGKIATMVARCVTEGEKANRVIGCNDDRRDDLLGQMVDFFTKGCDCPALIVGAAESAAEGGGQVTFPLTSPPNSTADFIVPVAIEDNECLTDLEAPVVLRWCFDHEIDPSTNHTGFNVSASDGTNTIGTIIATSNGNGAPGVHVGPGFTPHNGPRDKYWVDIEVTLGQLLNGLTLSTSAFGTITAETETIYSQDVTLRTDLSELGCDC